MITKFKIFENTENYTLDNIYNWWSGIKVSENENDYILDLSDTYMTNKVIPLKKGLYEQMVNFYCPYLMKRVSYEVKNLDYFYEIDQLIFKISEGNNNIPYIVDISKPLFISKIYNDTKKYNL